MALSSSNTFTLTWKLQNISMCIMEDGAYLSTSNFVVELLDKTEWYLKLYPKDEKNLSCHLGRHESKQSSGNIKIGCSMVLVSVDNLLNITKTRNCCTFDEDDSEKFVFGNADEIFAKRDVLLPSDTLTIRCSIWRIDGSVNYRITPTNKEVAIEDLKTTDPEKKLISDQAVFENNLIKHVYAVNADTLHSVLSEKMYLSAKKNLEDLKMHLLPNAFTIRSQILYERRMKIWEIKKFNEIQINETIFTSMSGVTNTPSLVLALYLSKDDDNDDVHIDIQINHGIYRYVVKCIITILNTLFEDQDCITDTHLFNDGKDIWHIPLAKKSKLCKDKYLKKGSLLLRCEFIISEEESLFTIEETVSFPSVQDPINEIDLNDWNMGLLRTINDGEIYDVVLKSGEKRFYANKVFLSASSPVFLDLLDDFDETTFNVTDCEPEILDKLLKYMYSGVVEDMTIESYMKLYSVAKAYKVVALERVCSYKLRSSLDVFNVSQVLVFSDLQKDEVLKMAALKFISVYQDEVFHSLSWKTFMGNNAEIAGEAMHCVLTRKFNRHLNI